MVVADDKDPVFAGAIVEGGGGRIFSTCNALFLIDNTVGQGAKYLYVNWRLMS